MQVVKNLLNIFLRNLINITTPRAEPIFTQDIEDNDFSNLCIKPLDKYSSASCG